MEVGLSRRELEVLLHHWKVEEARWGDEEPDAKGRASMRVGLLTSALDIFVEEPPA